MSEWRSWEGLLHEIDRTDHHYRQAFVPRFIFLVLFQGTRGAGYLSSLKNISLVRATFAALHNDILEVVVTLGARPAQAHFVFVLNAHASS